MARLSGRDLVLYDGVCGLCNRLNRFVLAHDASRRFDFAALQSETGRRFVQRFERDPAQLTTLYVVADYQTDRPTFHDRSDAVLFVARALGRPWHWLGLFSVVPQPIRDAAYDFVARRRYRIMGQYDTCPRPTAETRARFIDV